MRKTLTISLLAILILTVISVVDASGTTETITTEPPHTAKTNLPSNSFGPPEYVFDLAAIEAEVKRQEAEVAAYLAAVEAERIAKEEAERLARQRLVAAQQPSEPASAPRAASSGTYPGCEGVDWIIPVGIVWRESRCNFHAINHTGCSGFTCVGAYQFDLRHWIPREEGGWGGCAWLGDWRVEQNQIECARQMSRNGTYLAPWGW